MLHRPWNQRCIVMASPPRTHALLNSRSFILSYFSSVLVIVLSGFLWKLHIKIKVFTVTNLVVSSKNLFKTWGVLIANIFKLLVSIFWLMIVFYRCVPALPSRKQARDSVRPPRLCCCVGRVQPQLPLLLYVAVGEAKQPLPSLPARVVYPAYGEVATHLLYPIRSL